MLLQIKAYDFAKQEENTPSKAKGVKMAKQKLVKVCIAASVAETCRVLWLLLSFGARKAHHNTVLLCIAVISRI